MVNRLATVAALAVGGYLLSKQLKKTRGSGMSSSTTASIEVNVPVSTAYNQFTQFENFPQFMDSVHEVRQLDDTHLHWRASVAGKEEEWDSEITEQIPDKRIAWRSITGVHNAGVVTFHKINENTTRIMLQMDYEPQSIDEQVGDTLGLVKMQTQGNLKRFKQLLEARGTETGAWRGSVTQH
ncbi:SRPBCC family protein [Noviherbaspirillum sp. CPCC 100848]|uniref:SRPBCC family protein n=1 Tax=Noviherbaspirillum album TaxID=3080276 RepID=A0ABU6J4A2_9BURK|nr:SRPBCC family protein [Noviherbaspirillum sp. CPCC 100848]MEC4718034.1 SRPBCC family protein [Noviherbaspirillum sp. CPCC 100848]